MSWWSFVLYCHISPAEEQRLCSIKKEIKQLLENQDKEGLLILFIDTGLQELLSMIHPIQRELSRSDAKDEKQKMKDEFLKRSLQLCDGQKRAESLQNELDSNVRVITALDLVDIFGEMYDVENLKGFILGVNNEIRYDTPKFIEAIVRLRMIGSRVPVLRLDKDVLLPPNDIPFDRQKIELAVSKMCQSVFEHHERTQVLATILSANYELPDKNKDDVLTWQRGYATRILPSLLIPNENDAITYISELPAPPDDESSNYWKNALKQHFQRELTIKFIDNLWKWGASSSAVISGALLYMSDAVVINIPPFSNFSQPVMWIDDHLRYVLHREMGDFCRQTHHAFKSKKPLHVFYEETVVPKYRKAENFMDYTAREYLPTLLWGSFMDFWLCPDPDLKKREEDMSIGTIRDNWLKKRKDGCSGFLAQAVIEARSGYRPDEAMLRQNLRKAANTRLQTIISIWGDLKYGDQHSFASAWVSGNYPQVLNDNLKKPKKYPDNVDRKKFEEEYEKKFAISCQLPKCIEQFEAGLETQFNHLLDDVCRYVKWVFEWPHVMSVIRSVPPGDFKSDLGWEPPDKQ